MLKIVEAALLSAASVLQGIVCGQHATICRKKAVARRMGLTTLLYASIASAARSFVPRQAAAAASVPRRATTVIDGLQELPLDRYDAIILDQYGVLHNGEALLGGVADALESLQRAARKLVVLSNTSKRRGPLIAELPGRGFRSEWLHDAICSGECCWEALRDSGYASAVVLGWSDRDSSEYLSGTGVALAGGSPDVIVAYGPDTIDMAGRDVDRFPDHRRPWALSRLVRGRRRAERANALREPGPKDD